MRAAAVLAAAAVVAGCAGTQSSGSGGAAAKTSLEISVWMQGTDGPVKTWTLRCPGRGTLPNAARACRRLGALKAPFAPIPRGAACTLIYGGPHVADVRGRFRGRRLVAKFTRTNGCEIERWDRVRFLFPVRT